MVLYPGENAEVVSLNPQDDGEECGLNPTQEVKVGY